MQNPSPLPIIVSSNANSKNPRDSLEKIFEHYMNCSSNEFLIDQEKYFKNIKNSKENFVTTQYDIIRAMELIIIEPTNKEILELYSIVKNRYADERIDIKTLEKTRFKELVAQNNPPLELSQLLLENIDSFNLDQDYEIIKKLNLNKNKSENAQQIFDKTFSKFYHHLSHNEKILLKNRFEYDEILKKYDLNYDSHDLQKFLNSNIVFDSYIFDDLKGHINPIFKNLTEEYFKKSRPSRRLSWGSSSPANSGPPTPNIRPQSRENSFEKINFQNINAETNKKIGCAIC